MAEITDEHIREVALGVINELTKDVDTNTDVPTVGSVDDTYTLPGYRDTNGTREYVKAPMSVFRQPAEDAATAARSAATNANDAAGAAQTAAATANTAAQGVQSAIDGANEAAREADASRLAIEANESTRQQNEQTRESHESSRVTAEHGRVSAESARVSAESGRVSQAASDHSQASSDHSTAASDHSTALVDHQNVQGAENVNAELSGMTVTITNRQGQSTSVNIGFEIYRTYTSVAAMNADASNVPTGKFVMIATTDPTSAENARLYGKNSQGGFTFLSDLDQASSAAWADWLDNMKPQIEDAIDEAEQAASDVNDVVTAWNTPTTGYKAQMDTALDTASSDHTQAATDHSTASSDHSTATGDHTQAGIDHGQADDDHTLAASDHTTAGTDHTQATSDHARAEGDHTAISSAITGAENVNASLSGTTITVTNRNGQSTTADLKGEAGDAAGFGTPTATVDANIGTPSVTVTASGPDTSKVFSFAFRNLKGEKGDDLHYEDMTEEEKAELAQKVLDNVVIASTQVCEDIIDELT